MYAATLYLRKAGTEKSAIEMYCKGINKMQEEILVSIITVAYNSEQTISGTIESVLQQTYTRIEYIIIDGLSTDDTVRIAESYRDNIEARGIHYKIVSEQDDGIYDAMNKGIKMSSGELIGIINSDDWYEDSTVEKAVKLYKDTNYDLMYADIRMVRKNGNSFIKHAKKRKYVTSRDWNHPTQFVDRKVYMRFQYKCENISDDMDLLFRVIKAGYHIEVLNEVLANFQMGGISNRIPMKEIVPRIQRRYRIYRNNGFSRWYLVECVGFEIAKFLLV